MAQLLEFAGNHLALVSAFCALFGMLIYTMMQDGGSGNLSPQRAVQLLNREDALPVDVRSEADYRRGHILNAVQLTLAEAQAGATKLAKHKSRPLLVYCESGANAGAAVKALKQAGFEQVHKLGGGIAAWRSENLPLQASK